MNLRNGFSSKKNSENWNSGKNWKSNMPEGNFTNLAALQLPLNEFTNEICHQFENLRAHNFTAKAPASYLTLRPFQIN